MPVSEYTPKPEKPKKKGGRPPSLVLSLNGISKYAQEWAAELGIHLHVMYTRRQQGWSDEKILSTPVQTYDKHQLSNHPLLGTWREMIRRCYDPRMIYYGSYGGRGIDVCQGWHDVHNFVNDVIERPNGLTLDRIRNDDGYWCGNCADCATKGRIKNWKWSSRSEQQLNRRSNHLVTYQGRTMPVTLWAKELGVKRYILYSRLDKGWSVERTFTEPVKTSRKQL